MQEKATFAMGCFWGVQMFFDHLCGVVGTQVGYTGGKTPDPTHTDLDGHAEAVEVTFDPSQIPFTELLGHFWDQIDPAERPEPRFRNAVFTHTDRQYTEAVLSKKEREQRLGRELDVAIQAAGPFHPAEEYHQKYYLRRGVTAVC